MEYGGVLYLDPRTMYSSASRYQDGRPDSESVTCCWETVHRIYHMARDHELRHGTFEVPADAPMDILRALAKLRTQERRLGCAYAPEIFAQAVATPLPE